VRIIHEQRRVVSGIFWRFWRLNRVEICRAREREPWRRRQRRMLDAPQLTVDKSSSRRSSEEAGKPLAIVERAHAELPVKCAAKSPFVSKTALHGDLLEA
jgi:hypothetical protein